MGDAKLDAYMDAVILPVWKAQGWEQKLIAATQNTGLMGPLQSPYEPWHWRLA
jgi:hypothetical protein